MPQHLSLYTAAMRPTSKKRSLFTHTEYSLFTRYTCINIFIHIYDWNKCPQAYSISLYVHKSLFSIVYTHTGSHKIFIESIHRSASDIMNIVVSTGRPLFEPDRGSIWINFNLTVYFTACSAGCVYFRTSCVRIRINMLSSRYDHNAHFVLSNGSLSNARSMFVCVYVCMFI